MKSITFLTLFLTTITALLTGCTRPEGAGQVNFQLPARIGQKVGKQGLVLKHVIFNSQLDGETKFCSLDSSGLTGPCAINGQNISLGDLKADKTYLFQVLLVSEDSSSGSEKFEYGDQNAVLKSGDNSVEITVKDIFAGATLNGHMKGRYLTDANANTGPSGKLVVKFAPGSGKPAMKIMEDQVYGGWISGPLMPGVGFEYSINGEVLFGGAVKLENFVGNAASPNESGIAKSDTYGGAATARYKAWNSNIEVTGFFGPGVTTSSHQTKTSACTGGTEYISCIAIGNSQTSINGVFGGTASGSVTSFTAGTLGWKFLPGITAADFDAIKIYKISGLTSTNIEALLVHHDTINCEKIQTAVLAGTVGYSEVASVPFSASPNYQASGLPAITTTSEGYFVCPFKGAAAKNVGVVYPMQWMDGGGGGCATCGYVNHSFDGGSFVGSEYKLTTDECYKVDLTLRNGMGGLKYPDTDLTISLPSLAWGQFHLTAACSSPTTTALIPDTQSGTSVYFKPSVPQGTMPLAYTFSSGSVSLDPGIASVSAGNPSLVILSNVPKVSQGGCYPILVRRLSYAGFPLWSSSSTSVSLSSSANYYAGDNSSCSSGTSSITISGSTSDEHFYYSPVAAGSHSVTLTASGFTGVTYNPVTGSGNNIVDRIKIFPMVSPMEVGRCQAVVVQLLSGDGSVIPAPTAMPVDLRVEGSKANLFADPGCVSVSTSVYFSVGDTQQIIYIKPHRAVVGTAMPILIETLNSTYPVFSGTTMFGTQIYVDDPTDSRFLFVDIPDTYNKMKYFGSHEFRDGPSVKKFPLRMSGGMALTCSTDGSSYSSGTCASFINGPDFTWPIATAQSVYPSNLIYLRATDAWGSVDYVFDPDKMWPAYKVVNCDRILDTDTDTSSLNFNITPVVCVAPNVYLDCATTGATIGGSGIADRALIGSAGATDIVRNNCTAGLMIGDNNSLVAVANLNFTGTGTAHINLPSSALMTAISTVEVQNNNFSVYNRGVVIAGSDPDYSVAVRDNSFQIYGSSTASAAIEHAGVNSLYVERNIFGASNSSNTHYTYGVFVNAPGSMDNSTSKQIIGNTFGETVELKAYGNATNRISNLTVKQNYFQTQGYQVTPSVPLVIFGGVAGLAFEENYLNAAAGVTTGAFSLMSFDGTVHSAGNSVSTMKYNVFANAGNGTGPMIASNTQLDIDNFRGNDFVLNKSSGDWGSLNVINLGGSGNYIDSEGGAHAETRLCSSGANPFWNAFLNGTNSGAVSESEIQTKCKKAADASYDNRCKSPCDP